MSLGQDNQVVNYEPQKSVISKKNQLRGNKGQATIEFTLMLTMILFLVLAHVFYAVTYVKILIKDYQAFMVTRSAYLATQTVVEQREHMNNAAKAFGVQPADLTKAEDQGVYKMKFNIIIPKFTLKKSGFLSRDEVAIQVPYRSEVTGEECRNNLNGYYEDNGC